VFDHLIESRKMVLDRLAESKSEYRQMLDKISSSIVVSESEEKESYQVLSGENSITSAIKRIIAGAQKEIVFLVGEKTLMHFYHAGLIDDTLGAASRDIAVHLHTSCTRIGEFVNPDPRRSNVVIQTAPETNLDFVIVDNREIVAIMQADRADRSKMQGFYTNQIPIITVFRAFSEKTA
jgi:sugar-specific transcriptional regulator TrmB